MSDRVIRYGIAAALLGHALLLALLSLAWGGPQAPRIWPKPQAVEVSLVKDVALEAKAPPSPEPPAASVAPEVGQPVEAPPPAAAAPAAPPDKTKPAPAAIAEPAAPRHAAAASPASRLTALGRDLAAGAKADAPPARQRGTRLGSNFLAGLAPDAPATRTSAVAPGTKAGPYPTASIQQAIARQIQPCADRQVNPGPGANQIVTTLNLRLNPDGTLAATPRMVRQAGIDGENERYAQRVVDLGVAAFKGCSPLTLPADYYQTPNGGWSNINYQWKLR